MGTVLYWVIATMTFLSELVLVVGVGRLGFKLFSGFNSKIAIALGVITSIMLMVLWGYFLAPRSDRRLDLLPRIALITVMTLAIGFLLYRVGDKEFGLILMIPLAIIQIVGQYMLDGK